MSSSIFSRQAASQVARDHLSSWRAAWSPSSPGSAWTIVVISSNAGRPAAQAARTGAPALEPPGGAGGRCGSERTELPVLRRSVGAPLRASLGKMLRPPRGSVGARPPAPVRLSRRCRHHRRRGTWPPAPPPRPRRPTRRAWLPLPTGPAARLLAPAYAGLLLHVTGPYRLAYSATAWDRSAPW